MTIIGVFMTIVTTTSTKVDTKQSIAGSSTANINYISFSRTAVHLAAELLPYLSPLPPPLQIKANSIVTDNLTLFFQHVTPRTAPHISVCELSRNILTLVIVAFIPISNFISFKHMFNETYSKYLFA